MTQHVILVPQKVQVLKRTKVLKPSGRQRVQSVDKSNFTKLVSGKKACSWIVLITLLFMIKDCKEAYATKSFFIIVLSLLNERSSSVMSSEGAAGTSLRFCLEQLQDVWSHLGHCGLETEKLRCVSRTNRKNVRIVILSPYKTQKKTQLSGLLLQSNPTIKDITVRWKNWHVNDYNHHYFSGEYSRIDHQQRAQVWLTTLMMSLFY